MSVINIIEPVKHGVILIPVPSEKLGGESPYNIDLLETKDSKFEVVSFFKVCKNEPYPSAMMYLSTGQWLDKDNIWNKYRRSDSIYLFICKKRKNDEM